MHLEHSFPTEVRELFRYHQYCFKCKRNQNAMLEIHHMCGRKKHEEYLDSALNASVLCKDCHDEVTHSFEERIFLLTHTRNVLEQENYALKEKDGMFLVTHSQDKYGCTWQELLEKTKPV